MNFPAIAKQTFEKLKEHIAFSCITQFVVDHLKGITSSIDKARFLHDVIDDYNRAVFAHPIVTSLSPCRAGCSACCHTQVSITDEEADLLISKINEGIKIDYAQLKKQMLAGNSSEEFYKLSYQDRMCIFLGADKRCLVYEDRPAVCRTNAVLGESSQCSTENSQNRSQELRLVKTLHADMAIYGAFLATKDSGSMASMIGKKLFKKKRQTEKKSIFNYREL